MKGILFALAAFLLAPVAHADDVRRFGLMLDAGVPDGANGSLVYRPMGWLRLHAGGGTNLISPGVRAGVSLLPFGAGPSVSLEGGHYFRGDANALARAFGGDDTMDVPALREVGYDYANFHVGLDFGSSIFTFYVHGGMSYLWGTVKNAEATFNQSFDGAGTVTVGDDPSVRVWSVSARVGLIFYVLP